MFGFSIPNLVNTMEIISRHIKGLKKDANIFWFNLSTNILWYIWKIRNADRFEDQARALTESFWRLTFFKIVVQVASTMNAEKLKLLRFLKHGNATMFINEMKDGYEWRCNEDNISSFEEALKKLNNEIKDNREPSYAQVEMLAQIQS